MHLPAGKQCILCNEESRIHRYRVCTNVKGCVFMKISVISGPAAGRCCFLLGMVRECLTATTRTSMEYAFHLISSKSEMGNVVARLFEMEDRQLDMWERVPGPRATFDDVFHMRFDNIPIEWNDIKSEAVSGFDQDSLIRMSKSDCIMICMDGSVLKNVTGSTQDIADYWYEEYGGGDIDNFMRNYLRLNNGKLPFICFVVTKMDTMDPKLLKSTTLDRIVSRTFPDWFEGRTRNGGHIAAVCPISALGYEFMDGGPFNPVNAEKPLLAALKVVCGKSYEYLNGVRFYRDGKWIDESEI